MARRRMTLRRIDPWSVLKFGAVVNACLFVIVLLGSAIVWFAIRQLGIIDQACDLATDVGFESCAVNGGNLFRYLFLLGLLWVVIQTGLFVFFAFLHNLIADLVGGIALTLSEEGAVTPGTTVRRRDERTTGEVRREGLGTPPPHPRTTGAGASSEAPSAPSEGSPPPGSAAAATGRTYGAGSSTGSGSPAGSEGEDTRRTPYERGVPSAPPTTAPRQPERPSSPPGGGWPWDPTPGSGGSSGGTGAPSEREAGGSERPRDRDREAGGSERPRDRDREDRDDDQLFGPRDR